MRRWLVLFLLVLLPLQFTWSAAAAYCEHESEHESTRQAQHFGHHVHAHGDAAGDASHAKKPAGADKAKGKLTVDSDCGNCHLSAAKPVPATTMSLAGPATRLPRAGADKRFSTRAPDHPERPNWRIA